MLKDEGGGGYGEMSKTFKKDLSGMRFGRLTVQSFSAKKETDKSFWNCICDCGNKVTACGNNLVMGKISSCGKHRTADHLKKYQVPGKAHPHWKGGKFVSWGYVRVHVDSKTYKKEHRLIAEEALGKTLPKGVVVHHINGIKTDNRPTNLLICSKSYHGLIHARMKKLMGINYFSVTSRQKKQREDADVSATNQEAQEELDNRKPFLETYSDRGCPSGHPCPKKCEHIIYTGIPETEGTPVFCEKYEKVRYAE